MIENVLKQNLKSVNVIIGVEIYINVRKHYSGHKPSVFKCSITWQPHRAVYWRVHAAQFAENKLKSSLTTYTGSSGLH